MNSLCAGSFTRDTFSISSSVKGYHVYKDIWEAAEGEVLACTREMHNLLLLLLLL